MPCFPIDQGRNVFVDMRSQGTEQTDDEDGLVTLIQRKLFDNYHTVAYILIIGTYIIAFAE